MADPVRPYRYEYDRKTCASGKPAVCTPALVDSVTAAFPDPRVWRINPLGDVVDFAIELTASEKTTLDGVIAAWNPDE